MVYSISDEVHSKDVQRCKFLTPHCEEDMHPVSEIRLNNFEARYIVKEVAVA